MDFFGELGRALVGFIEKTGISWMIDHGFAVSMGNIIMICIALVLIYLAIAKDFEPLLLIPIAFGMLLVNLPISNMMLEPKDADNGIGGLLYYMFKGDEMGIFPPLIFMGVGALTDFGPLIANPKSFLLGAAAQLGIFFAFFGALLLGFTPAEAASIGIIGGADGPTSIFLTTKLAPHLLGPIAVAAYSYMALVPMIQPPIMRFFTTEKERIVKMEQLRPVTRIEKIVFPIIVTIIVILILPDTAPLIGMLMFGNLIKESGVTPKLAEIAGNQLMYIIVIFLGISVGATTSAANFLNFETLKIFGLGIIAFGFGTAGGVWFGKIMCAVTGGKVNPLIGAAGVSAVPMSARVVNKVGREYDSSNYLLMHAMGPNVAGVIGSAVAAGVFLTLYGGM